MSARNCPFPACTAILVSPGELLCWRHWERVPVPERASLKRAFIEYQAQLENPVRQRRFRGLLLKAFQGISAALAAAPKPEFRRSAS